MIAAQRYLYYFDNKQFAAVQATTTITAIPMVVIKEIPANSCSIGARTAATGVTIATIS